MIYMSRHKEKEFQVEANRDAKAGGQKSTRYVSEHR